MRTHHCCVRRERAKYSQKQWMTTIRGALITISGVRSRDSQSTEVELPWSGQSDTIRRCFHHAWFENWFQFICFLSHLVSVVVVRKDCSNCAALGISLSSSITRCFFKGLLPTSGAAGIMLRLPMACRRRLSDRTHATHKWQHQQASARESNMLIDVAAKVIFWILSSVAHAASTCISFQKGKLILL